MKRYLKEIIILFLQLLMFYVFPLSAGPADTMGMVLLILISVLVLSLLLGILSTEKIRFLYPVVIAVLFLPSVFIYYNDSALIHAVWYLVISAAGMGLGTFFGRLIRPKKPK